MSDMIMKITNVKQVRADKRAKVSGGLYIEYTTADNTLQGAIVSIIHRDKISYFEVTEITVNGELLNITAKEIGHWAIRLEINLYLDVRQLIGLPVSVITDEIIIRKVREENLWT